MFRKISLIVFLAISLALFLVLRPYLFSKEEPPSLHDMLPNGDYLVQADILELAREASGMLYFHKVPFREFLSKEFLLAQAKSYGVNLQRPCYLFANEDASWGAFIEVLDSSKIFAGIDRLRRNFDLRDTTIHKQKVYVFDENELYLTYDKRYLMVYQGKDFNRIFNHVKTARKNTITPTWRFFLNETQRNYHILSIFSNSNTTKDLGIQTALFYPSLDSTHISLNAELKTTDSIPFRMKPSGQSLPDGLYTTRMLNLHLNVDYLRDHPEHKLYQYLLKKSKKISFPMHDFIQSWDGDLSFHQGGLITVKEKYIEFELDENFEAVEVEKIKVEKVAGFNLFFTTNATGKPFITRMLQSGILTKDEQRSYRLLFSPALHLKQNTITNSKDELVQNRHLFYASSFPPKLKQDPVNKGVWTHKGTPFEFYIDSLTTHELFARLRFPAKKIIEKGQYLNFD